MAASTRRAPSRFLETISASPGVRPSQGPAKSGICPGAGLSQHRRLRPVARECHIKNAYKAYEIGSSFAGHWGERNHAEAVTTAITVAGGASFPAPAGSGLSFTDTQHGNRGNGALHAVATGAAAGFLSAAHYSDLSNATPNNYASTLVKRDAGGNFSAQTITMASASVTGASTFGGLTTHNAGATMASGQHVTVSGAGRFKFGPMELPVSAAAFRPTDGSSGATPLLSGGEWTFSTPPQDKIAAGVSLPIGARILVDRVVVQQGCLGGFARNDAQEADRQHYHHGELDKRQHLGLVVDHRHVLVDQLHRAERLPAMARGRGRFDVP
jgi:hypothetical protein